MINLDKVTLRYGDTYALRDISLRLPENGICGLLGRNGAGKTSLLSLLCAYRRPTSGNIRVLGENPYENPNILPNIAYIYDNQSVSEQSFRVKDLLKLTAALRPNWDAAYADKLVELFDIPVKKTMGALSHGQRSSVHVIIGLAGRTRITLYDEAYLGMDAAVRKLFIHELLEDYMRDPKLILFSTHYINEVESLFNEAIILGDGRIIAHEDCDTLRSKGTVLTGRLEAVDDFISGREILSQRTLGNQKEAVIYEELTEQERLSAAKAGLELTQPALQDLFIHLTEKGEKQEDGQKRKRGGAKR